MITAVDDRLRDEAKRFRLRFACCDCAHAMERRDDARGSSCSLGFPDDAHRAPDLGGVAVVFCKAFELL